MSTSVVATPSSSGIPVAVRSTAVSCSRSPGTVRLRRPPRYRCRRRGPTRCRRERRRTTRVVPGARPPRRRRADRVRRRSRRCPLPAAPPYRWNVPDERGEQFDDGGQSVPLVTGDLVGERPKRAVAVPERLDVRHRVAVFRNRPHIGGSGYRYGPAHKFSRTRSGSSPCGARPGTPARRTSDRRTRWGSSSTAAQRSPRVGWSAPFRWRSRRTGAPRLRRAPPTRRVGRGACPLRYPRLRRRNSRARRVRPPSSVRRTPLRAVPVDEDGDPECSRTSGLAAGSMSPSVARST